MSGISAIFTQEYYIHDVHIHVVKLETNKIHHIISFWNEKKNKMYVSSDSA